MNLKYKNPRDQKYREVHDGEHEYNPPRSALKTSERKFPAAVLTGLELAGAVKGS